MKDKTARIFDKSHHFTLGICLFLGSMLISCGAEQGDWTAVQREGRYIYGVWHGATSKNAEQMLLEMAANIKNPSALPEQSSTTEEGVKDDCGTGASFTKRGRIARLAPIPRAFNISR